MLKPLTPIQNVQLQDFVVTNTNVINPNHANTFEQGMWFRPDANNAGQIVLADAANTCPLAFPVWSRRGEGSTQMLTKLSVILFGQFMADTDQFDPNGTYTPGVRLMVVNGLLTTETIAVTGYVHGVVVKGPTANGGNLRFVRMPGGAVS